MELSSFPPLRIIEENCLTDWAVIGSGGFGQIHKARHLEWCCNVAIKLLHIDDGTSTSLLREINMMHRGSSPYVIQVLGVFKGRPPSSGLTTQLGLVMEVMERGSLASLQKIRLGGQHWPLVFRLAHQVALGINFLHSLSPAMLHLDLKPSNVLLDGNLNAKLTDFGLSKIYHSITRVSKIDRMDEGGTNSYMPPEAFDLSYSPNRASDIYSYGILLWSMVAGKQPYPNAMSSIVRFRIPQGDRPSLDEIRGQAAGVAGLIRLINLMERCWHAKANQRPTSRVCTTETEDLYKMHKHAILDAVHQVLKKMSEMEQSLSEQAQGIRITQASVGTRSDTVNVFDVPTGRPPIQEVAADSTGNQIHNSRFNGLHSPHVSSVYEADLDRSSTDHKVKVSPVQPVQASPSILSTGRSPQGRTSKTSEQALRQNQRPVQAENGVHRLASISGLKNALPPVNADKRSATGFERQLSSPDTFPWHRPHPGVNIHMSSLTGFQLGNNNIMHILTTDPGERKRHPTAPPRVNHLPPQT